MKPPEQTPLNPSKAGIAPRLKIYVNELPDGQMQVSIQRAECYSSAREVRYVDALRELLLKELPALCARVEGRPLPKVRLIPTESPKDLN